MSLLLHPQWPRLSPYLHVVECARDGGLDGEPRIRIEFLNLPAAILHDALYWQMPCVACKRPIHPLRRREGDADRLYYGCTCQIGVRMKCARGAAARVEYERFREIGEMVREGEQLSLF